VAELDVEIPVGAKSSAAGLTIAEVETIAIRVPLARTYHGSAYKMTHRSTIVTRIRTEEGVVGEAYCGDEDAGLLEIDEIVRTEIAPRLIGEDAFRVERCWELSRSCRDLLR
jgi:D-galactarolactone cycloisomerase